MRCTPLHPLATLTLTLVWLGRATDVCAQPSAGPHEGEPRPRAEAAFDGDDPRVVLELLADVERVPAGQAFRVGVRFALDPGWHVYWKNPGQSGLATEVSFEGAPTSALAWPAPERFEAPGPIVTYGYAGEVLLFAEARAPEGEGAFELRAVADFLVCEVECIPGRVTLAQTLQRGERAPSDAFVAFDASAARVPRVPSEVGLEVTLVAAREPARGQATPLALGVVRCAGPCDAPPLESLALFPAQSSVALALAAPRVDPHPSAHRGARLSFAGTPGATPPERFEAVLTYREGELSRAVALAFDWPPAVAPGHLLFADLDHAALDDALDDAAARPLAEAPALWAALLLALLGGLVLNLMPCVLPVLGLKVFGLVRAASEGHGAQAARRHALGYLVGVIASMQLLALVVLALRAAGVETGMGFQLQEPRFVALLSALLVVLSLSFFGVFELHVGATRLSAQVDGSAGIARSLGEGVLVVVLATPCSAPFLGTAVGFAFASDAPTILAIFATIGLGLALPFALVALVPALARWIPKPGAWMVRLQRGLGFLLLATVIWLVWIYGQLVGVDGVALLLGLLLACAFATWLVASARGRGLALVISLPLVLGAGAATWRAPAGPAAPSERAWTREAVAEELAAGRSVLVVFTADWCLTCKANERLVLARADVRAALAEAEVSLLVADWTRRDETIRAELARHGRAGVPLYLLYRAGTGDSVPEVLPELLRTELLIDALRRPDPRRPT